MTSYAANARAIADIIRRFVAGNVNTYEWDDLMGVRSKVPILEEIRLAALAIQDSFPATVEGAYCNTAGLDALLLLAIRADEIGDAFER